MLVLSRRPDESLKLGDDVTITILGVRGDTVRIGVAAPRSLPVHRREVYERIQAELAANPQWALEEVEDVQDAPPTSE